LKKYKTPISAELLDFAVSYWFLMLCRKTRILFPDDFKCPPCIYLCQNRPHPACQKIVKNAEKAVSDVIVRIQENQAVNRENLMPEEGIEPTLTVK
jgi:hypothetical protein